jgi:putative flavoprotein involved in K+ transport
MRTEHIETVVIGAGQAGLATGYHLQRAGRPFVILDGESRVGDGWRHQWDTLRLFTPAWADVLPGMPPPGPRWSFPTKDEFADYLEAFAARFDLPVRLSTTVERLERSGDGYAVITRGGRVEADNVVVATGTFGRTPQVPAFADQLDPAIRQLHSSEYRRPSQLADGPVLVVGASHSGCDIAYDAAALHRVVLCGPDGGEIPVPLSSPVTRVFFVGHVFRWTHVLTRSNPLGRRAVAEFRGGGTLPRLRVRSGDLRERGVERVVGRVTGVRDGLPVIDDQRVLDVSTVVWCTGFRQDFRWIDVPVFGADGWPLEDRGEVASAPGLFFGGLCFTYSAASMTIHGAGRDAAHVARLIERRHSSAARRTPQAAA